MKCLSREQLFATIQHLLEAREERAARAHLAECAACRDRLEEYQRLDQVLDEWEPVEPSPAFDARLAEAVRELETKHARRGWLALYWLRWLAPACVLLIVVTASVVMVRTGRQTHPLGQPPPRRSAEMSAPRGNAGPTETAEDELNLYKDLPVLENYDLLADFGVLSELSRKRGEVSN